jgi:hypothetical protein
VPAGKTARKTARTTSGKTAKASTRKAAVPSAKKPTGVEEYVLGLSPLRQKEIQAVRRIILGVNPKISEEIKWAAPSFALGEHFCTVNAWAQDDVQLIFHHGPRKATSRGVPINDPDALLEWLATDRASIRFESLHDIRTKKAALQSIVRQWIKAMRTA